MTANALNVEAALTGAVYVGQPGATPPAPTDAASAWASGWYDVGYIDDKGVTESYSDQTTDVIAWQTHLLIRRIISKSEATFKFTMLETKQTTLELFHKSSTMSQSGGVYQLSVVNPGSEIRAFGFDIIDGTKHTRIYVPTGEVTQRGNVDYKANGAIAYEVTVTAYPNSSGAVATKFSADAQWGYS